MRQAIKNKGKTIQAWELGCGSDMEQKCIADGKIKRLPDGRYEIFTLEAKTQGEIAAVGDFLKADAAGNVYPNGRRFFLENHRPLGQKNTCEYEQIPKPLYVWNADEDPMCPEIAYLIANKGLTINADGYTAPLWGTIEHAARDAVIVFYSITYGADGTVCDADFNFVARDIFDETYTIL